MQQYDDYTLPTPDMPEVCAHSFEPSKKIIREYSPELCNKIISHGRKGLFIEGFSGKYNVCTDAICNWLSDTDKYADFNSAVKIAISACLHYWNEELNHAISNADWQAVVAIKGILADIMRSTPKQLREGLFSKLHTKTAEEEAQEQESIHQAKVMNAFTGGNIL